MHLLAAKPGGFTDEEGIIDLEQSSADIVLLSAADGALAALADSVEQLPEDFPSIRLANWVQLIKPAALDLYMDKTLVKAKIVVVSMLGGAAYWPYGFEQLLEWQRCDASRHLILVPGDDTEDTELMQGSSASSEQVQRVWRYLRQGGALNNRQLFYFLAAEFLQCDYQWHEPEYLPHCMIYMPGSYLTPHLTPHLRHSQGSFNDWRQYWVKSSSKKVADAVLLFYRSHLQSANVAMFDALIASLEQRGLNILPIAIVSLKDPESLTLVNALVEQSDARLIINTTGFASNTVSSPGLSSEPTDFESPFTRNLPVLQLILSSSTEDDWQTYSQGLRVRDIAMQIVLPEMDGRIVTRAISFKAESHWSKRCEISVVRYVVHRERAEFIAKLSQAYLKLNRKENRDKRLAVILANYPTKDGRIGNGVGLDTPASTVVLLRTLQAEGYPLTAIPEDGTALIQSLLASITNNPNTLHHLPCWQSLSLERYRQYFAQMPQACQQAVIEQWGEPEQDPKCRQQRLMLAGIRLGKTFVGIQPARGFNINLLANYHDPDLIPPHSYLAFYFWLRYEYHIDAIVHMGKHGNLEWLPGKGTALSQSCWPDIALGPIPHFYPFIVNDPGEGAQAKRRTQAVIIDHLMPPMTRAEVYGDLAELESLVDEYYQAMGMDTRREAWLREKILKKANESHILQELPYHQKSNVKQKGNIKNTITNNVKNDAKNDAKNDEETTLNRLDSYLCEIKEAQIRHGLHVLGQLPETNKLSDTLVALLRLPRGTLALEKGLLHNLAADLSLTHGGILFDPLQFEVEAWQGNKPACLQSVSKRQWRTTADTRERLELLAIQWLERFVLGDEVFDKKYPDFLNTAAQFRYAKQVLYTALKKSVHLEINSLIKGLSGRFVEPGPSGAPTRGRLDALPTGRNFFSVDNRSIPSPAAWAIGQRSAQTLIERHLQEQGDYPKQLGLSVWGTATMRTGGDDIAQAFSLMGIKPVWAVGSHRVVDFEIVPCILLRRPRVDVTLRVSGFFRDAFPNVIRLYDAAVQALAAFDDTAGMNTVQYNIQQREAQLQAEGVDTGSAKREASYRVFGSKPGAYGAGLQGLIDERCWEVRDDLAEAYLNWGGYAYGNDKGSRAGVNAKSSFRHRLRQLDVVVQNQDNHEHDLLDSDDYYQFQGGMSNAVSTFSGKVPVVYHNDHSNPAQPKVRTLKEELNRVIRSRVLNPKWIAAMREHGYKGAFEMAASVDYLFAYDATTNLIDDYQYEQVADALVFDQKNQHFLQEHNPAALEEMAERLLEAIQRDLWQDKNGYKDHLQNLLLAIDDSQEMAETGL